MYSDTLRPAIAMIELIFAIVIIGITLLSAPLLLQQASSSGYVAIQQEGISEAATRVNMVMSQSWDESTSDTNIIPPIVQSAGDATLAEIGISLRRLGTPRESYRSFFNTEDLPRVWASALGTADTFDTDIDDIDDYIGTQSLATVESAVSDYVEGDTTSITTAIEYNEDATDGASSNYNQSQIAFTPFRGRIGSSNIKSIEVNLTSTSGVEELEKKITFRAFSCNIGGSKLEGRSF